MPPKRSNKRAKHGHATASHSATTRNLKSMANPNATQTSKALELPFELILEILSYFDSVPVPLSPHNARLNCFGTHLSENHLERSEALRVLSQTCRDWRKIFFRMAWESLEVCATHSQSRAWYKVFGDALIQKSSLVCNNAEIASQVRSFTVIISRYSPITVLPAFVRAIEALPNCHTLQILRSHHKMSTMFKGACEGHTFPQIRTVVLPSQAHHVLRRCPEARKVICNSYDNASQLLSAIAKNCKKVEEIEGVYMHHNDPTIHRIPRAIPNLRVIKLSAPTTADVLKPLAKLAKLETIVLSTTSPDFQTLVQYNHNDLACIKAAQEILRSSKATGRKTVVVRHHQWCHSSNQYIEWSKTIGVNDKCL